MSPLVLTSPVTTPTQQPSADDFELDLRVDFSSDELDVLNCTGHTGNTVCYSTGGVCTNTCGCSRNTTNTHCYSTGGVCTNTCG